MDSSTVDTTLPIGSSILDTFRSPTGSFSNVVKPLPPSITSTPLGEAGPRHGWTTSSDSRHSLALLFTSSSFNLPGYPSMGLGSLTPSVPSITGSHHISSTWPPNLFPSGPSTPQLTIDQANSIFGLASECQALGIRLAKDFQVLSGLEAIHRNSVQGMAHEMLTLGHSTREATYVAILWDDITEAERKAMTHHLHSKADATWKKMHEVMWCSHHISSTWPPNLFPSGPSTPQLTIDQANSIFGLASECQALGIRLAKDFQVLSGLEAIHRNSVQGMAHEMLTLGHSTREATYVAILWDDITEAECKAMTHHLHSKADATWKKMHEVMYNHQLEYDRQLADFLKEAETMLANMRDQIWTAIHTLALHEGVTFEDCLSLTLCILLLLPQIPVDVSFQTQIPLTIAYCQESLVYRRWHSKQGGVFPPL